MSSDRMQELRKKFQGNAVNMMPTPENQFGRIKKSKEEQAKAAKVAKARAARYNLTLRSLAIRSTTDIARQEKRDREAKIEVQKRAAKYNMTSRALPVSSVVSKRDQENLGKALALDVSPNIAKEVLAAVAKKNNDPKNVVKSTPKPTKQELVEKDMQKNRNQSEDKGNSTTANDHHDEEDKKIVMDGLEEALQSGDEDAINKAILKAFLETSAPHLVGKMDKLMNTYKSHMQDLFDKLANEFPDAHDAEINGQLKADKEITQDEITEDVDTEVPLFTEDEAQKKGEEKKSIKIELDDDDDSVVVDADIAFENGYKNVITQAEQNPDIQKRVSAQRRISVLKNDLALTKELRNYNNVVNNPEPEKDEEVERRQSVESESSLVEVPEKPEVGYIVAAKLEVEEEDPKDGEDGEKEEKVVQSRWAVQLHNKNYALKQKLMKQGLSKKQVDELVENLDNNTSEML